MTVQDFLAMPESNDRYELIEGEIIPKVSPKRFHAGVQKSLIKLVDDWASERGHFYPEWAVVLKRRDRDWVPVPDLTYVSFERLAADWLEDAPCPVPADWVIEIISPDQTFGGMAAKASDYLTAGILRVWVLDSQAQTITVFAPDSAPLTYQGDNMIADSLLPGLELQVNKVFERAGLSK
ncbi:hypothetical protein C1752_01097 [Acaryochloris thomasi RCC1774]|uniref:Putative restriction endonuclease domain-containing protein n=1 Tax=Acaryochloris thomasi RCC1774 TaxID=1764569 RepID=A0A2W1JNF7_9CYAN|nr:Uma2 family endonuclease [Acaryochloris thomasi]PZD74819.1 hypothetical protein C1752_01097 [Acaryochloris thomasi RCC1774]